MHFRLFTLIFSLTSAVPILIPVNEICKRGDSFWTVEPGALLFVASTDEPKELNAIRVKNAKLERTLDEVNRELNSDGSKVGWKLTTDTVAFFASANCANLTGVVYITTAKQADDPNFLVYHADRRMNIQTDRDQTTIVIISEHIYSVDGFGRALKTTKISNIQQRFDGKLTMYRGAPGANYRNPIIKEVANQKVFENPLNSSKVANFFYNIDPMQVNFDVFYVSADKFLKLLVEPVWEDPNSMPNNRLTSTGLITCQHKCEKVTIGFSTRIATAISGAMYNTDVYGNVQINIQNLMKKITGQSIGEVSARIAAQQIVITPSEEDDGFYAFQYFLVMTK
ncbi:unnamed protein product [Caenorhabditis bovis]|uniref:Uncharacterized protein n=1 Tax=Caenorhabditis bovis TaxID=2654633 RepID=A0A8S1EXF0_9PELO|nr:unnamed protein product [Caenorhabditis bovis]